MKRERVTSSERQADLMRVIAGMRSADDCRRFFADLCTPGELRAMVDRWSVVQLVDQELPYRVIHERTGVSTATITRVARALSYGEGGYRRALDQQTRRR